MDSNDIEFVTPEKRVILVDAKSVEFSPLTVAELPPFVRTVEPFLSQLLYSAESLDPVQMVAMIGHHGDAMIEAVAMAARQDKAWVGGLLPDRLAYMAALAVEVNRDFFTRAVEQAKTQMPRVVPKLLDQLLARLPTASPGQKPSTA